MPQPSPPFFPPSPLVSLFSCSPRSPFASINSDFCSLEKEPRFEVAPLFLLFVQNSWNHPPSKPFLRGCLFFSVISIPSRLTKSSLSCAHFSSSSLAYLPVARVWRSFLNPFLCRSLLRSQPGSFFRDFPPPPPLFCAAIVRFTAFSCSLPHDTALAFFAIYDHPCFSFRLPG